MAVDRTSLITRFPEFTATTEALVNASIAEAKLMVDTGYYGAKADMAITYLAAHLISVIPLGEYARLEVEETKTVYWMLYEMVQTSLGAGCRAI